MHDWNDTEETVLVEFPNGDRRMMLGSGAELAKTVIEDFAPRLLAWPAVLWVGDRVGQPIEGSEMLMRDLGLLTNPPCLLPDLVLADMDEGRFRFLFVDIVMANDPAPASRQTRYLELTSAAGYQNLCAFVSVVRPRDDAPMTDYLSTVATDTMVWRASEPDAPPVWLIWSGCGLQPGLPVGGGRQAISCIHPPVSGM